jgi:hypothetical protein
MSEEIYYLIENNSQICYKFTTLKELKQFAKSHNLRIKKSWDNNCYYTKSFVYLPLFEE